MRTPCARVACARAAAHAGIAQQRLHLPALSLACHRPCEAGVRLQAVRPSNSRAYLWNSVSKLTLIDTMHVSGAVAEEECDSG